MTRTVAATIAVFVSSFVQADRDVRALVAGQTVERSLDSGEPHTYQLTHNARRKLLAGMQEAGHERQDVLETFSTGADR